jgi:hypothetical protein
MADIELQCPVCDKTTMVSEFADPERVLCSACGKKLNLPSPSASGKSNRGIRMAVKSEAEAGSDSESDSPAEWRFVTQTRIRQEPEKKVWVGPAVRAWLVFAVLASVMTGLRYYGWLPPSALAHFKTGAPIVYGAFHLLITLKAFKDSVYNGTLCLLLPPYSIYYAFLVSDDFYLRAVFGGVLAGIGWDSFLFFQEVLVDFIEAAHRFVQGGALQ